MQFGGHATRSPGWGTHALGIIHRDIKPGNLLIDREGRAVLSDFGIAEDTIRNLLANPQVYGLHAAPELLQGQGSSVPTDIFAIGCTLHRLLTGEYPFAAIPDIQNWVPPTDPHRLNAQVPLSLRNVVQKSLARDPADRYADARGMSEDLGGCGIRNSWTQVADPATAETWRAETADGIYEVRVIHRPRAGDFDVVVRRDQGSGLRQVFREQCPTRRRALQARRTPLARVVEGDDMR